MQERDRERVRKKYCERERNTEKGREKEKGRVGVLACQYTVAYIGSWLQYIRTN